jgi:Zn-dependent protease
MDNNRLAYALLGLVSLILSVTIHEFAHAFTASKLGDDLPSRQGRVTLNPMSHVDPIGTLLIPMLAAFFPIPLFGWGRPVQTQPHRYTRKISMRAGHALVAFAGPLSNLLMAIVCTILFILFLRFDLVGADSPFRALVLQMAQLNLVLFILNLIPFPPLDGSAVAAWIFGQRADGPLDSMSRFGGIGLYAVLYLAGGSIAWAANAAFLGMFTGFSGLLGG